MSVQYVIQTQQRDSALLEQLFICRREAQQQRHRGATLPTHLVELVSQTAATFRQQYDTLQSERSSYKHINQKLRAQERELQRRLRHALQGVRRHQQLLADLGIPLSAFGLTEAGTCPEPLKRMREPVEIAKNILNAHRAVEARSLNILRDPTAAELREQVETIEAGYLARKTAKDREQAALAQMRQTRVLAHRVLRTVRMYIQNMSLELEKDAQRTILKGFGFKYIARKTPTLIETESDGQRPEAEPSTNENQRVLPCEPGQSAATALATLSGGHRSEAEPSTNENQRVLPCEPGQSAATVVATLSGGHRSEAEPSTNENQCEFLCETGQFSAAALAALSDGQRPETEASANENQRGLQCETGQTCAAVVATLSGGQRPEAEPSTNENGFIRNLGR